MLFRSYPSSLLKLLHAGTMLAPGSPEELSLRAASIVAVERVRAEMQSLHQVEFKNHQQDDDSEGDWSNDEADGESK